MNCIIHPERGATAYCRTCGKPMCGECTRSVHGVLYCENCLATMVNAAPGLPTNTPSPVLAALVGFIPGLGAIFNGEYIKGIIHIAIFAGIIAMLHNPLSAGMQTFFGVGLGCFCLYMPVEAYRTARAKQIAARELLQPAIATAAAGPAVTAVPMAAPLVAAGPDVATTTSAFRQQPGKLSPVTAAVILITLGILLLLANLGLLAGEWFGHWWPAILVGIGVWLLWKRNRESATKGKP